MFPFAQIALNSFLFTLVFAIVIWGSFWWNVRVWLHDFPQPIQAALPPLAPYEKRQQKILMGVLLVVMIGVPLLLNWQLRGVMGAAFTFPVAFASAWFMLQTANLYDALGIDLLIAVYPLKIAVPAGAEPYLHLLLDKDMHLRNFVKGVFGMSVLALLVAVISLI